MDETNRIVDVVLTIQDNIKNSVAKIDELTSRLESAEAGYNKYINILGQIKDCKREKLELIKTMSQMIKLYELTTGKTFEEPNLFNTADTLEAMDA